DHPPAAGRARMVGSSPTTSDRAADSAAAAFLAGESAEATKDCGHAAFRGEVGGFCCPVPPEPRLSLMQRQRAPHYHWHLSYGPITAEPCRAKSVSLPRVSSLCRPHAASNWQWWRRRALPPGPLRLFHAPFI